MKKITTLFKKDINDLSKVINEVDPANSWVYDFGIPTVKYDGTSCAVINGKLCKRFDLKKGRKLPCNDAIECSEANPITGHHPHWVPITNSDKYHSEGLANSTIVFADGTYELIGPKVQSNPHNFDKHMLIKHGLHVITDLKDYTFEGIKEYLSCHSIEGIVFHHSDVGDDRMCKIRRKDFGFDWPVK